MFSKRQRGYDEEEVPPARRLRSNIGDLFLSSDISGRRAASLIQDAAASGSQGLSDLSRVRDGHHAHRDLLRRFAKGSRWPTLYYAEARVWNQRAAREERTTIPMLLPHEIIGAMAKHSLDDSVLFSRSGLDEISAEHLLRAPARLQMRERARIVGLSLWMDGVAARWDRSKSVDVFTLALPGLPEAWRALRVPVCALPHECVSKGNAFDNSLAVPTWSLRQAALGKNPAARHDGTAWGPSDAKRRKDAGKDLGCTGLLCQVVGDWKMLKEVFRFPQHNEVAGCCFLCGVRPDGIRETSSTAPWRTDRLGHWGVLERLLAQGRSISPLFSAPGVLVDIFKIDWLHVVDLGIAADWVGQVFAYLTPRMPGGNKAERVQSLWRRVSALYNDYPTEARLGNLTEAMLSPTARSAKLRAHGAECRALVPIAGHLVRELVADDASVDGTVRQTMASLEACYSCLSARADATNLGVHCRRFCTLWVALERLDVGFHIKPKTHLFQELCEMQRTRPALHWTYRDEDFGGSLVSIGRRRGGHRSAIAMGRQILVKFCARHPLPNFLHVR